LNGYDAILFDFDGVLADSEPLHCASWCEVLQPLGISLDWQTYSMYCIGIPDREAAMFFCGLKQPPADFEAVWSLYPAKSESFVRRISGEPPILDSVRRLLPQLREYRLGVVTATERRFVEPALRAAGIFDWFDLVLGAEDVAKTKPAPEPYLAAMERLGAVKGLAVEDSDTGEASARQAGLDVVRVAHPGETAWVVLSQLGLSGDAINFR